MNNEGSSSNKLDQIVTRKFSVLSVLTINGKQEYLLNRNF